MAELLQFATRNQYTGTWFWKNDLEEWIKYGDQGLDLEYSSEKIEEAFQRGDKEFDFQHGFDYRIDFEVMKQVNRSTGTRRDTMREITFLAQRSSSSSGGCLESAEVDEEEKEALSVQNVHSEKGVTQSWQKIDGRWIENDIKGTQKKQIGKRTVLSRVSADVLEDMKQINLRTQTRRDVKRENNASNQPSGSENLSEEQSTLESNIPPNLDRSQVSIDGFQGTHGGITSGASENAFQPQKKHFRLLKNIIMVADMEQINLRTQTRRDVKRENNASNQPSGSENLSEEQSTLESNIPPNSDRSQASIDGSQGTDGGITSGESENAFQPQKKQIVFHLGSFRHIRKFADKKQINLRTQPRQDIARENNASNQPSGSENLSEEQSTLESNIPPNSDRSQVSIDGFQGTDGGITSGESKNAFQPQKKQIVFDLWRFRTIKKFADRKIINLRTQTRRDVKRENNASNQPSGSENLSEEQSTLESNIPPNWDRSQASIDGFQLVPLHQQHSEYSMVKKLFAATMNTTIQNVSRIQNVELWENFTRKKKWMSLKNEGQVEERLLFHGTSSSSITGICKMNFDMRLHGKHGALYGKGVYFAKNAMYSDRYVTEAQFSKQMILARVLVGEFVQGSGTYPRPPEKAPNILYDSCVDDISNPEIFVIFEKDQMYPEYLLEYEKE